MAIRNLGRYEIVAELGRGAMGVVYKAIDPLLDRVVAIKTINLAMSQDELAEYEARFRQEAKATGRINHPNIVTVYDVGNTADVAYMAMEYLEGRELRDILASGASLALERILDIAAQVAEGLAYAHEHNIVHRDIKPSNIMIVRDGLVKITDFGIARIASSVSVKTLTGVVLGSPKYMSPEQVMGERADHRSDIFSLGVVLYEMLTGVQPFSGDNINTIMFQTINLNPPPPQSLNSEVPEMLNYIVARALAKKVEDRYQSAREMAVDLRECRNQVLREQRSTAPAAAGAEPQEEVPPPSPSLGISPAFDSSDATIRLASLTGMAQEFGAYVARRRRKPQTPSQIRAAEKKRTWIWGIAAAAAALLAIAAALLLR